MAMVQEIESLSQNLGIERRLSILTDKQIAAVDGWLDDDHAVVACLGANRSGKTFGLGCGVALDIREYAPKGSIVLCVAKDSKQSVRNQQKDLWDLLPQSKLDAIWSGFKNGFGSESPTVTYDKGGRSITILFMTQSQYEDNWRAFEAITAYKAWCDESVSAGCFAAVGQRVSTSVCPKVGLSTIRDEGWIDDLVAEAEVNDKILVQNYKPADNPVMTEERRERQKLFARFGGEDIAAMRIDGASLQSGSRVFTEFDRKRHVITQAEFEEKSAGEVCWYACLDSGMDHPTVWLLVAIDREGCKYVVREYVSRNTSIKVDVPNILGILGDRQLIWPTVADPALWQNRKTGMEAKQFAEAGLKLVPGMRTHKFGEDFGVQIIKDHLLGERLYVLDGCKHLIENFCKWKYKRDREGNSLEMDRYEDRNNDGIDALRYLLTKTPRYKKGVGHFVTIGYDN